MTVTTFPERETVAFHPQNGSRTTSPSTARVPYLSWKAVPFITIRAGTSWRRGRSKIFEGSEAPYPSSGGTTIRFVSPTAIPRTPWSNPLIAAVQDLICCSAGVRSAHPTSNEKFVHCARQLNDAAFGYETLSLATRAYAVSKTRPSSANVPT